MKISQEELVAAYDAWRSNAGPQEVVWTAILEAAYTVRKQRKAAKRERQRKEKDKQVVESAKPTSFADFCEGGDESFADKHYPSKAPEWDGKFRCGNWQTRKGHPVKIIQIVQTRHGEMLMSDEGQTWALDTGSRTGGGACHEDDLIRPWPKGEQ